MPALMSAPRTATVTSLPRPARYSAACPAELALPITATGLSPQSRASSSVAGSYWA
jgi:hypothetical protein